jgi:uncharacterized damage-inducible protein DinB
MSFELGSAIDVLRRTPSILHLWLGGLGEEWTEADEGPSTWNASQIVGHLVHGEETDWMTRVNWIRTHGEKKPFPPFDRFAQETRFRGWSLDHLLERFDEKRQANLSELASLELTPSHLDARGLHPALGPVTLGQLLATWVAHDLDHLAQIARVMAKRYAQAVGPWAQYLRILG